MDRLFRTADGRWVNRQTYRAYLEKCAKDWERIANGSYYGIVRPETDAAALKQAARVRELAASL
jgi:hypothetical protein